MKIRKRIIKRMKVRREVKSSHTDVFTFSFPSGIKRRVGQDSDQVQDSNVGQAAHCGLGPHGHWKG